MDVFVCWDGDKIGRRVGRAVLADDVGEVRRVDQAINAGNELWKAFALNSGGSVIEMGGDEGRIVVDASKLAEMPQIAKNYSRLVGATVSVGVGMKMSESAQALVVAKLRGGNQILVWDPTTMAEEYRRAAENPKSEADKLSDEYLAKADTPKPPEQKSAGGKDVQKVLEHNTAKLSGSHAGFAVQHEPGFTDMKHPGDTLGGDPPASPPPEMTHAAGNDENMNQDMESALHSAAEDSSKQDEANGEAGQKQTESAKQQVADALVKIRKQLPDIVRLQQYAPDAYKSIIGLVQSVIILGKEVAGDGPPMDDEPDVIKQAMSKSEDEGCPHCKEKEFIPHKDGSKTCKGCFKGYGEVKKADSSPIEGTPPHHRMNFPLGSVVGDKVKVAHGDGDTSWKQVGSGMVQAQDAGAPIIGANSHPVSSREPSST
jgi:hypothetical protein